MAAPHLLADPAATRSPDPAGDWLPLSAALTTQVPAIAGRDDLVVACAPGAGHGSPACYLPALARVEVDGTHLGVDPAAADPARPSDRERYPATWGALTHEAAHAAHSGWAAAIPATAAPAWAEAAILLEESRIEARQLRRRPGDRRWLRASATEFVLNDFPATAGAPPPTPWQAAHAAALLLARADAGVLDEAETAPVAAAVTTVLGEDTLNALRAVWRDAHAAGDAQRAAGARPAAEPFTRVVRRHVPSPPLRVGIACDISGSMSAFAGPAASAAWILARAASLIPGAQTATVTYGDAVRPVTRPGHAPAHVTDFTAPDSTEKFCQAIDALDGALGLSGPGAARLMVIISDGAYTADERTSGQRRLGRLARAGCGILWLAPDTRWADPMTGTHAVTMTDPAATADTIARAATRALQAA